VARRRAYSGPPAQRRSPWEGVSGLRKLTGRSAGDNTGLCDCDGDNASVPEPDDWKTDALPCAALGAVTILLFNDQPRIRLWVATMAILAKPLSYCHIYLLGIGMPVEGVEDRCDWSPRRGREGLSAVASDGGKEKSRCES
jgi:hypothetical protein